MARKKKEDQQDDFTSDLISQINKAHNDKIAFNLGTDDAPTNIKRWIGTGSTQLDFIISNQINGGLPEGRIVEIQGPTSCHAAGDRVLLHDGRTIAVENVKVGMKLLGPDGTPRKVLQLVRGTDQLYKITQKRSGYSYTVNSKHKLALKCGKNSEEAIIRIPVEEYINKNSYWKRRHRWFHVPIEKFNVTEKSLPIPSYILGLLLGDGSLKENRIELTTADDVVKNIFCEYVEKIGFKAKFHHKKNNKAIGVYYTTGIKSNQFLYEKQKEQDPIKNALRTLELLSTTSEDKFIPDIYKFASIDERRKLLAGLIDADGHYNQNNNFDYVTKSKRLANDLQFVANSIGLVVSNKEKLVNGVVYYRLCLTGHIDNIPTKVKRKQAKSYKKKNPLQFGITVEKTTIDQFYGFTVDKDNLYLGEDFSVIVNSGKSHIAFEIAKSTQRMGGIVVYVDTENATSLQNLMQLGIDVKKKFVFVQTACTEDIFQVCEDTIIKARAMKKDVPVTIIWDSIAASSPKAELEGAYDKDTIGLQARVLGKGLRKITNIIANQNVLMVLINQQRMKIGVMFGDPCVSPETKIRVRRHVYTHETNKEDK